LRTGSLRNRVPDLWLGDMRGQKNAMLTCEKRIRQLCGTCGKVMIKDFVEDWLGYVGQIAKAETFSRC
jgi:N-methylhydantoinase B